MLCVKTIQELRGFIQPYIQSGKTIGFVPTMGFLHSGHASLIERAKEENDVVVVSIFVNPTQFGPNEDFETYPRDIERDLTLAESVGATIVFNPDPEEMYDSHNKTYVEVEDITSKLCGKSRPGHFQGVTTVVTKLFNIVKPNRAYFGQKDAQQAIVIQRMVKDLNMDLEIVICPIVREEDGLALSSRNVYLNADERKQATILYKSLVLAKKEILDGQLDAVQLKAFIEEKIQSEPLAAIDYVSVVDGESLEDVNKIEGSILIALAVRFGQTRLIDNLMMEV
jgi:pantoate--beta-alanine ligase